MTWFVLPRNERRVVMDLFCFLFGIAVLIVFLAVFAIGLIYMQCPPKPNLSRSDQEKVYLDPKLGKTLPFPNLTDPPSVDLSVIGIGLILCRDGWNKLSFPLLSAHFSPLSRSVPVEGITISLMSVNDQFRLTTRKSVFPWCWTKRLVIWKTGRRRRLRSLSK